MADTVYDHIRQNNIKIFFLILMFPVSLCIILLALILLFFAGDRAALEEAMAFYAVWAPVVMAGAFIWTGISYYFGDKMMLNFAGAKKAADDKEHHKVYTAVENVALAAGLPTPEVYIIDDGSLNAFATGRNPKNAAVAMTAGIIEKLSPAELEAVIAHEMAHIGNRDVRLHIMIITGLGIFGLLGDILLRVRVRGNGKNNAAGLVMVTGLALLIFNWAVAPLIKLAISRTNEYNADATAALITRNPAALADALDKIKNDPQVEVLDESPNMAIACIFDPLKTKKFLENVGSTHPPVEERMKRLRHMARQG